MTEAQLKQLEKITLLKQKEMGVSLANHTGAKVKSGDQSGCKWEVFKDTEGSFAYKVDGVWSHDYNDPFMYDSESECVTDAKSECDEKAKRKAKK